MRALAAALVAVLLALPCRADAQEQPTEDATAAEPRASEPAAEPAVAETAAADAAAQGPAADSEPEPPTEPWPAPPQPPVYETWWFWTAIAAVVVGVTLAIVVGVTTEHPRSSRAGLVLAF